MKRLLQHMKKTKGILKRIIALVAAVAFIAGDVDITAFAGAIEPTGTAVKNAYLFEVVTGINSGKDIQFLEVVYTGEDNKQYRQLFFPNQDSQYLGRLQVAKVASDNAKANDIKKMYGYTGNTGYLNPTTTSLDQYSTAQFYFTTDVAIKQVEYFEGFTGAGNSPWTCQGMRLFKVDNLYGLRMAGEWSDTWYVDFQGKLIAELPIDTLKVYNWSSIEPGYLNLGYTTPSAPRVRRGSELEAKYTNKDKYGDANYINHESQTTTHSYGFRFDFADGFGAGLESLINDYDCNRAKLYELNTVENFGLNITYVDIYGEPRFLYLPGSTSAVYWAYRNMSSDDRNKPVLGVAQQGGSLVFAGTVPDCAEISDVSVALGSEKAEKMANVSYSEGNIDYNRWTNSVGATIKRNINKSAEKKLYTRRSELSKKDEAKLLCSAIYNMSNTTIVPYVDKANLKYKIEGTPIYTQSASTAEGKRLVAGSVNSVGFKSGKKIQAPTDTNNYYVVQFTTENAMSKAEVSGFKVKFSYVNTKGEKQETDFINVKQGVLDYYGYWPGSTNSDDFAYKWTTGAGMTTSFMFGLKNVNYFTGAVISSDAGANEDYQFKDFCMYSLTKKGDGREIVWVDKATKNGNSTYLNIYRDLDDEAVKIANISDTTLIQNGGEVNVDFTSSKITSVKDEGYDFTKYSITYADAMKNHGFGKARKSYEVQIDVYDDTVSTDDNGNIVSSGGNGDAGSENKFFFQLEFEWGNSAYVLGNQGLEEGDKFVSGRTHTFTVHMNEDYGNVTGINIISDEVGKDAKPEDKLRISDIRITEVAAAGTHICWVASNVGWVGADYSDDRNKYGGSGNPGKSAAEIARTVNIDYTTNMVQIEFSLTTGSYQVEEYSEKDAEANSSIKPGTKPRPQLYGTVDSELWYVQSDGSIKSKRFDLVEALYSYRNKVAPKEKGLASSDKSTMFRANHTDRFLLNVADVSALSHLDMSVSATDFPVTWAVTGLSARIVKDAGKLKINQFDEYEYDRGDDSEPVACMDKDKYMFIIGESSQPCNIYFDENLIKIDPQLRTATSVLSRTPSSVNDKLNIFVFPSPGKNSGMSNYDLSVKAYYNHLYSGVYQAGDSKMKKYVDADGTEMFYTLGLNASCMSDLSQLVVAGDSLKENNAYMSYAIVQQVRSGVVVNTYYINLEDENVFYTVHAVPTGDISSLGYAERQKLYLQIGESTPGANLVAEKQDIAFSITYKLPFDVSGTEYSSPYVYATDGSVKKLAGGQVVGIDYSQMFVGEITGIRIAATGNVTADIDRACVANYHVSTAGEYNLNGYYNFAKGTHVSAGDDAKMATTSKGKDDEESIRHLSVSFKSSYPSSSYESGTTTPVKFTLYTVNEDGQVNDPPIEISDIRKYINDGSENFTTGETKTIEMLITGAAGLRRIILEPQSETHDGSAGWSLDSVVAQLDQETPINRVVDERIYEGRPKTILLSDLSVSADVYNYNYTNNAFDTKNVRQGEEVKLIMQSDQPLHIVPTSNGSEYGCVVYATEITEDGFESGALADVITHKEDSKRYTFNAPKSYKEKKYRIYIESAEVSTVRTFVEVTVAARPEIKVSADVTAYNNDTGAYNGAVKLEEGATNRFTVEAGAASPLLISPAVTNSSEGFKVSVKELTSDGKEGNEVSGLVSQSASGYEFKAPSGYDGKQYKVNITSVEDPDKAVSFVVAVEGEYSEPVSSSDNGSSTDTVSGNSVSGDSTSEAASSSETGATENTSDTNSSESN